MKKRIINRSIKSHAALTLALLAALVTVNTAGAAYWNRSRIQRGSSDDSGGKSSGNSSSSNSRGRDLDRDGIPNITDPDVDEDGILNGADRNTDGGIATAGKYQGKYIGDRLPNDHPAEKDIDNDGLADDSAAELDIDGDGLANATDPDIDGDGLLVEADLDDDGDGSADAGDTSPSGASMVPPPGTGNPTGGSPVGDGKAPAGLAGVAYVIRQKDGRIEATLNFGSATAGKETDPDGDNDSFSYVYTPGTTTAALRLQFKSDKWDEYDLNYATGGYVRREFDKNALKDTDTGSFHLEGVPPPPPPPPGGPGTQIGDGTAPAALTGIKWVIRELNGKVEANLLFTTATDGSENDPDGDIDPFTYVYQANGATATLRLNFKPGKWDEYDLNFVTGLCTRREFKNNALDDTDHGRFAPLAP